jgi:hypothetical protein
MIVGVAIRNKEIMISLPKPARHSDCFKHCQKIGIHRKVAHKMNGENQGFITDKGRYLTRWQAYDHAKRCGQKLIDGPYPRRRFPLCSEDLW